MASAGTLPAIDSEYQLELEQWLRRRFTLLCTGFLIWGLFRVAVYAATLAVAWNDDAQAARNATLGIGFYGLELALVSFFLFRRRSRLVEGRQLLRAAGQLILGLGLLSLLFRLAQQFIAPDHGGSAILDLGFWHLVACSFLPWTPRQSLRPMVVLLALWAAEVIALEWRAQPATALLMLVAGPLVLLPGLLICWVRLERHQRRFQARWVGRTFLSMREELLRARTIHESLFPGLFDDGSVAFDYAYEPMRELGGDYLHVHRGADECVHLVILDVTGHGISAALTVNRLSGELERIRAEDPGAGPAHVIRLLNRYIHLTLAPHGVYATAAAVRVDPLAGTLGWCSAGHPPMLLRGASGAVDELPPTSIMLGALADERYEALEQQRPLDPGDELILYTDGAYEARDRDGRRLGLRGFRELLNLRPPPRRWPDFLVSMVQKHLSGRSEDDVLIAALRYRPVATGAPPA